MGIFRSLGGTVLAELTSADVPGALVAIAEQNIPAYSVRTKGELTVLMSVRREDYRTLAAVCRKRGEKLRLLGRKGLYWTGKGLLKRPLLLFGLGLMLAGVLYLPSRILFVRVEGNDLIPDNRIIEAAEESGIRFWASRREVRSERMKNALLQALPELQWAGVNTSGCVATISVRERTDAEAAPAEDGNRVSSIVAVCDGVILSGTVTAGSGLVQPGDAVTEGQVLISGYTDLGLCIRAERAKGEVFARTRRTLEAAVPSVFLEKQEILDTRVRYSILVGKNRINLWKDSGICEGSCDRMYEEYYVTLPGGFRLPLALARETVTYRNTAPAAMPEDAAEVLLSRFAERCLLSKMVSGVILAREQALSEEDGLFLLRGEYLCTEMIGRERQEKIGE